MPFNDELESILSAYSGSLNDKKKQHLISTEGFDAGLSLNDMERQKLVALGYTGALNDMWRAYLAALGASSGSIDDMLNQSLTDTFYSIATNQAPVTVDLSRYFPISPPKVSAGFDTPTYVGGHFVSSSGTYSSVWPTHTTGDLAIFIRSMRSNNPISGDPTVPSGVTLIESQDPGNENTWHRVEVYTRVATSSSEANVDWADEGNHGAVRMLVYRNCATTDPLVRLSNDAINTASSTLTIPSGTTTQDNSFVLGIGVVNRDNATSALSGSLSNGSLSGLVTRADDPHSDGNGSTTIVGEGTMVTAGSVGTITGTLVSTYKQTRSMWELKGLPS